MDNTRQLKTYVWHDDQCFFVSTIERDSSAAETDPPPRFMETFVWEYDWSKGTRGSLTDATTGADCMVVGDAFEQHMEVCRQLYLTGKFTEDGDGE